MGDPPTCSYCGAYKAPPSPHTASGGLLCPNGCEFKAQSSRPPQMAPVVLRSIAREEGDEFVDDKYWRGELASSLINRAYGDLLELMTMASRYDSTLEAEAERVAGEVKRLRDLLS